jgi:hypothetical protein
MLNIIHCPVFYLKHDVSDTVFCLRLQVENSQIGPVERANLCLQIPATTATNSTYWAHLSRFHLKTGAESSIRRVGFLNKRQDDGQYPEL